MAIKKSRQQLICTPKVRLLEVHIFMVKRTRTNRKYSPEFKLSVIMDMRENHMLYSETVRKYWNTTSRQKECNYINCVKRWERIYLEEGAEGLAKERRGKKSTGRPPKLDDKTREDLIAENQRLRIENEYLKKLDALVRKREQEEAKKQK